MKIAVHQHITSKLNETPYHENFVSNNRCGYVCFKKIFKVGSNELMKQKMFEEVLVPPPPLPALGVTINQPIPGMVV